MQISSLRLRNLLGNPTPTAEDIMNQSDDDITAPETGDVPAQELRPGYQPKTKMQDALQDALVHMPVRQPLTTKDRVLGALASGSGSSPLGITHGSPIGFKFDADRANRASDDAKYSDFNRETGDWQNRIKSLGIGANLEEKSNINNRILSKDQAAADDKSRRTDAIQQNADTRRQQADLSQWKFDHPHDIIKAVGNKLVSIDPNTGTSTNVTDTEGNEIDTGKLSETAKLHIQNLNRLGQINAQGANQLKNTAAVGQNAQDLEDTRQEGRLELESNRADDARLTKGTPAAPKPGTADKPLLPTQVAKQQYNRAQEALNSHPEWSKYIILGSGTGKGGNGIANGSFRIGTPEGWFGTSVGAGDVNEFHKASAYVYGAENKAPGQQMEPANKPPAMELREVGKTQWKMPDGVIRTWNGVGWADPPAKAAQ